MISEIRLQYYRQHENRTVTFGRGINAIRAPNGTGKTKLLEAISYLSLIHISEPTRPY